MEDLLFKNWEKVYHVAACTLIAYITLFAFLRIAGRRTLAKLNAFDFVVTVTLGSTLSFMVLAQVSMAEGSMALLIIILLQYILAWSAKKNKKLEQIINGEPLLLFYKGQFMEKAMKAEGITTDEIIAEIRRNNQLKIADVEAVVLELNGELSIVFKSDENGETSIKRFFKDDKKEVNE